MKKVLVADDKDHWLVRCTVPLEKAGYETTTATTRDQAIAAYLRDNPDAVLCDLRFIDHKDETGLQIGSEIRRLEKEGSLPRRYMVLMSQSYVREDKWKPAGFDAFFDKIYFEGRSERLIRLLEGAGV
ncbi:MAG: hypothetical protein HYU56_02210 [Candidatus Aenigmarchaeota archaeon]|nr:hypothetical protein [Candidatus Aenigmarchaeota archaeon]